MKKTLLIVALILFTISSFAQDKLFLVFEMMKVDNEQEMAYWETENFWEKIHQQRANNGDIIGWDLWQLSPGGRASRHGSAVLRGPRRHDPGRRPGGWSCEGQRQRSIW